MPAGPGEREAFHAETRSECVLWSKKGLMLLKIAAFFLFFTVKG
jgi:hypothetical protein